MRKRTIALLVVATLSCMPLANAAKPVGGTKAPSYTGRNLGVLPGDTYSYGSGVSAIGSVVGWSAYSTPAGAVTHPFYWDRSTGVMRQLSTSGATSEGSGHAFAIAGQTKVSEYAVGAEDLPSTFQRAVIWVDPSSQAVPIVLDSGAEAGSVARGVNEVGTAVGMWGDMTAIWEHDGFHHYTMTTIDIFPNQPEEARDINNEGIVVGFGHNSNYTQFSAFLRVGDEVVALLPAGTDPYATARAVSDNFATSAGRFVYVAGSTMDANGVERAVRWTVDVDTRLVSETKVLAKEWSSGVNTAGDVACTNAPAGRQSASLWRNEVFIALKPPKGMTDAASLDLTRTASSPTYVAGTASNSSTMRAVTWEVR